MLNILKTEKRKCELTIDTSSCHPIQYTLYYTACPTLSKRSIKQKMQNTLRTRVFNNQERHIVWLLPVEYLQPWKGFFDGITSPEGEALLLSTMVEVQGTILRRGAMHLEPQLTPTPTQQISFTIRGPFNSSLKGEINFDEIFLCDGQTV